MILHTEVELCDVNVLVTYFNIFTLGAAYLNH